MLYINSNSNITQTRPKYLFFIHEVQGINSVWNSEELPNKWKESIIEPVHKKGDKTHCNNYRWISLPSTLFLSWAPKGGPTKTNRPTDRRPQYNSNLYLNRSQLLERAPEVSFWTEFQ
jgi:hypothetical protein